MNPSGSKCCNECGYDLREPKEAPPVDYDQPQSYTPKHLPDKILTSRSSVEDDRHSVFGKVVKRMDVVKQIGAVKTMDKPLEPLVINKVTIQR